MKKIKVQVDYQSHSAGRGIGFYAENLIKALELLPEVEITRSNPDIIHIPFFDLFYPTLKPVNKIPTVVTIHDVTPLILKDLYPKGVMGSINLLRQRLALKNIKTIITDSDNSKEDISRIFNIKHKNIFTVPLAVDQMFYEDLSSKQIKDVKQKYCLPDHFVMCVAGGPNPNKNLPQLAEATKRLNLPLVLVGKGITQPAPTKNVHPELKDLVTLQKYTHIIKPGFVPTDDLVAFYKLAALYCQPSLYEGFGLPVLEAMAAGCLLIVANTSSLPEVASVNTPMFDPYNLENLINTINDTLKLSDNIKKQLIQESRLKAQNFSWEKTAEETLKVYRYTLQNKI